MMAERPATPISVIKARRRKVVGRARLATLARALEERITAVSLLLKASGVFTPISAGKPLFVLIASSHASSQSCVLLIGLLRCKLSTLLI